ncbi:MAG: UDP-N-acetylmuramoyl-L-alanine--D-glutamate ligase [Alphaproteobacteria bacterium]|nr:UDP-N-acetylmuramoyl-L-alanine--D-glutamate ligase [Alphaproteobacteria bacterium]
MITVSQLKGKRVAVMGLGKSGIATAKALLASGAGVMAWDDNEGARRIAAEEAIPVADLLAIDIAKADLVVWSPGIPHTFPQPHPLAEKARAAGVPVVCDVELLGWAKTANRILAVTGTNGKSTTTTLLAHVLAANGISVAAGGNLGTAALDLPDLEGDGRYVLELSSYQLELVDRLQVSAGVLLNVTPDHLGRHGGMEGYIAAKRRLFDLLVPGGAAVIGIDDGPGRAMSAQLMAMGLRVVPISAQKVLDNGISAPDGMLLDHGRAVCDLRDIPTLPGSHNWQNACAVYALARADGLLPKDIASALVTYPGLAHRQERVAQIEGVTWVNDSKATNADAVEKALVCYEDIHWIAGGQAKEGGIKSLEKYFDRIKHAYLIGEAAADFTKVLDGKVPYSLCGELIIAVKSAHAHAEPGDTVLLSPACASWDQFKSFEHRGEVFRDLVEGLK